MNAARLFDSCHGGREIQVLRQRALDDVDEYRDRGACVGGGQSIDEKKHRFPDGKTVLFLA